MSRKAVFFDIDGTIFEPGTPGVSDVVIQAIHHTQSLGHACFVASGRPYTSLPDFILRIGFDGYICGNGTQVVLGSQMISQRCLNVEISRKMIHFIEQLNLQYIILTVSQSCVSPSHDELFEYYRQYNIDLEAMLTEYSLDQMLPQAIKIETMTHTKLERELIKEFAEALGFFVEIKKDGYVELSDKTITKGTSLQTVCERIQIPLSDSIVLGDGMNDIDMFRTAGYRIAMGNAVDEIKQLADIITLDVSEDGAAFILNQLFNR